MQHAAQPERRLSSIDEIEAAIIPDAIRVRKSSEGCPR